MPAEQKVEVKVKGRQLQLTHIDKVFFPAARFTKAHVIDYYIRIAPFILPHLKDRPLTLKLYLHGIAAPAQYIKNAPAYTPPWVKTAPVWRLSRESQIHFILVNDLPTLVWTANLNNLEMHTFLARAPHVDRPGAVLFDLDPGLPATILDCIPVALRLREILDDLGLQTFVKSSGSKGLHLCVPLNTPVDYELTQPFAGKLAARLEQEFPDLVTTHISKASREGKVLVDYSQNAFYKTTASVYSLRAKPDGPFVSMPVSWADLNQALAARDPAPLYVSPAQAVRTCETAGDLFAPVLKLKQKVPADWAEALDAPEPRKRTSAARSPDPTRSLGTDAKPLRPRQEDQSALTRRSMARIAEENTAQWRSNR